MKEQVNRIAEFRKARGMTQHQLADRMGIHWVTVSKLERGRMKLTYDWAIKIGEALSMDGVDLFLHSERVNRVFVDGEVGKNSSVQLYATSDGELTSDIDVVEFGPEMTGASAWIRVASDEFFPLIHDGDLIKVRYAPPGASVEPFIDRLVLAEWDVRDGEEWRIGYVARGAQAGKYDLRLVNGAPIRDIKFKNLALVTLIALDPPQRALLLAGAKPLQRPPRR